MTKLQFRVLYREFLFRMVDLELLAEQGDITKLLGQFAGLLIFFSSALTLGAMLFNTRHMTPQAVLNATCGMEHFLIATTMLVVGLFAVLSWDSAFPDRRDVLVLAPLPIRPRTLFLAKVAALATALSLTVASLNGLAGISWPVLVLSPAHSGILGIIRTLAAYWITMFAAGAFIFCCVLGVQGLAAQLPRRKFLRVSALLQMAAFGLLLCGYFLEPQLAAPKALTAPENQRFLAWLPSYWFLGLFQALNGSFPIEARPALTPLVQRAVIGLAIAIGGAGAAFLLSYFRTLRKIVEEPDIVPGTRGIRWLPRFGNSLQTAVVLFSVRTLLRSRQHRVILAFYLGIGFAIIAMLRKVPAGPGHSMQQQMIVPLLISSILMLCFWMVGTRVVFAMPLDLRANWIFRITAVRAGPECLAASRRALIVLALAPVWIVSAAVLLWIWPWWQAAGHLVVLVLLGIILADVCLHGFQKIPFTCSYLPGKTRLNLAFLAATGLMYTVIFGVLFEVSALQDPATYARMLAVLVIVAVCARWRAVRLAKSDDTVVQFEEAADPAVQLLGLYRDGAIPTGPVVTRVREPDTVR